MSKALTAEYLDAYALSLSDPGLLDHMADLVDDGKPYTMPFSMRLRSTADWILFLEDVARNTLGEPTLAAARETVHRPGYRDLITAFRERN